MKNDRTIRLGVLASLVAAAYQGRVNEIMEVLKLCIAQGVQACNLGVLILAEGLAARATNKAS
jgi:hypothetical protein